MVFRAIESFGDLDGIERGAMDMLAEGDVFAACDMLAETGDFASTAAFLEKSLARNPAKPAKPGEADGTLPLPSNWRSGISQRGDCRKAILEAMRRRLNGIPAVPGLDDEEQKLAADLAEWKGWQIEDWNDYELRTIPWLIPAAWTNNPSIPDNAATRIARLGQRAIPFLMALQNDETPARRPQDHINDSSLFMTRGRVAYDLRNQLLPFDIRFNLSLGGEEEERAFIQREILDIGPDDLLLLYLRKNAGDYSDMPLLWAHLARRLESELPFLETAILAVGFIRVSKAASVAAARRRGRVRLLLLAGQVGFCLRVPQMGLENGGDIRRHQASGWLARRRPRSCRGGGRLVPWQRQGNLGDTPSIWRLATPSVVIAAAAAALRVDWRG